MKYLATLFLAKSAIAFQTVVPHPHQRHAAVSPFFLPQNPLLLLQMTMDGGDAPSDMDDSAYDSRQDVLDVARSLKDKFGPLIIDSKAQEKLKSVVKELEKNSEPPIDTKGMIGDWTLLCSTASTNKLMGIDTSNLPFFNAGIVKDIRNTLNKSLVVQQKIKGSPSFSGRGITRVDHVIQYMPPNELSEFSSMLPDALQSLNINPLEVTNQQVVLVHKAEVESTIPFIKTKLALESIVLNIAGKSQYLEPDGADLLGVNVPFGEFLNAGSFETTYLDDELRISRSKVGVVDQLRVFIKVPSTEEVVKEIEEAVETASMEQASDAAVEQLAAMDAPSDVEEENDDKDYDNDFDKNDDDTDDNEPDDKDYDNDFDNDGDDDDSSPSDVESSD
ncbi:unnamed protein product [Cylindrotheca closterium]|uniref:Plastid lipid-associated protein/fibrillin conserved domain-containing protein n=1 Tax=Cylindrotheca closterium TaxID=2856 RepID=A0AAD2CBM9_9STRA|nr:unnamed protein product [Cylindrotheca closterium]